MSLAAPDDLEPVRQLLNSVGEHSGADALRDGQTFASWLAATISHGTASYGDVVNDDELLLARRAREGIRALITVTSDSAESTASGRQGLHELEEVVAATGLAPRFGPDGVSLRTTASGVVGLLGGLLATVATAMADGRWRRMKLCEDPTCGWAYYDHSRNRSRRWCSMDVCGNRAKVRAYRARTPHRQAWLGDARST